MGQKKRDRSAQWAYDRAEEKLHRTTSALIARKPKITEEIIDADQEATKNVAEEA